VVFKIVWVAQILTPIAAIRLMRRRKVEILLSILVDLLSFEFLFIKVDLLVLSIKSWFDVCFEAACIWLMVLKVVFKDSFCVLESFLIAKHLFKK
jgi:hypothetical protein